MELQALPNLFDQPTAKRLRYKVLSIVEARLGKDSLNEVTLYEGLFSEAVSHSENPLLLVAERLLYRFHPMGEPIVQLPSAEGLPNVKLLIDPIRSAVIMTVLTEGGLGRWKLLRQNFEIVED